MDMHKYLRARVGSLIRLNINYGIKMNYQPNFNDSRVRSRLRQAYTYALSNFSYDTESMHSMQSICRRFGRAETDISKWLFKTLLICTDHHSSAAAGISRKYNLNKAGIELIQTILGVSVTVIQAIEETYVEEYAAEFRSGEFKYNESSDRRFHPLQNIRKTHKIELFYRQGYNHDYDINCCAPTLLYQRALKCGFPPEPQLDHYIEHRAAIRQSLAIELQTTPEVVKKLITALFQGARLGTNDYSSIYRELKDTALINRIQANTYITSMRESIRLMWQALPITDRRSGSQKNALYRELELRVLRSIVAYLRKNNNKHFTEHDGFKCEFEIDVFQMYKHVRDVTGYNISLSHVCLRDVCENIAVDVSSMREHVSDVCENIAVDVCENIAVDVSSMREHVSDV